MFRSFADVTPRGYQVVTPAGTAGVELLRNAAPGSAMREVRQIKYISCIYSRGI